MIPKSVGDKCGADPNPSRLMDRFVNEMLRQANVFWEYALHYTAAIVYSNIILVFEYY